jgi:WS/DGAT/MGAT family acyltransferase
MSEPLSALDATFLELEDADAAAHMHVGAALVFDPGPDGAPDVATVARHVGRRLGRLPRFGERLTQPDSGTVHRPRWEPAPDFDPTAHVSEHALPAPGGQAELERWLGRFFAARLDRRRPLWEVALVQGLEGGAWALVTKTHHCLTDGAAGVAAGEALLDTGPDGPAVPVRTELPRGAGAGHGLLRTVLTLPWTAARELAGIVRHPRRLGGGLRSTRALAELALRDEVDAAPPSPFNVPLGAGRRFLVWELPLEDLDRVRRGRGGTRNDVLLALVTAGLRHALVATGEALPQAGLRAMVPVDVRDEAEGSHPGNRVSSMFVSLPVAEPDPERRYELVRRTTGVLKRTGQASGGQLLLKLAEPLPPLLHSAIARALFGARLFNLTVTNVPGPPGARWALGCPLRAVHPLVPLASDHTLGVAALSYDDGMYLGLVADREHGRALSLTREGLELALRELPPRPARRTATAR